MHAFWQGIYSFVHVLFRHVRSHWICWKFFPTNWTIVLRFLCHFSSDLSHILPVWRKSVVYQLYTFLRMTVKGQGVHIWLVSMVTFGWSVVLDKGTTCYKFWGHRLKVKVMRRQPRKISCTLFFLLYYNMYNEFLWNFSSPYASCPPVCNLWLGFVTLTINSIIMLREMFHKHIWNFRIQIKI